MLRLLADDLTGALDSAAAFAAPDRPVPVLLDATGFAQGSIAVDSGTREADAKTAADRVRRLAPALFGDRAALAYKKIDSLLRGSEAEEIAAVLETCSFERCVIAPAFPKQGRVTRDGRQGMIGASGAFEPVAADLASELESLGHRVARLGAGSEPTPGVGFWNAESDDDLDAIVEASRGSDGVLWVGSGGLAAALARRFASGRSDGEGRLRRPVLGLFGSNHPVTEAQLAFVSDDRLSVASASDAPAVERRLATRGVAFATAALAPGVSREDAAGRIAGIFGDLVRRLDAPGTLLVAGGETLRSLCDALGARGLHVTGEIMPGIARSVLAGGRWDGVAVVSKSGAFGAPDLFQTLLAADAALVSGVDP